MEEMNVRSFVKKSKYSGTSSKTWEDKQEGLLNLGESPEETTRSDMDILMLGKHLAKRNSLEKLTKEFGETMKPLDLENHIFKTSVDVRESKPSIIEKELVQEQQEIEESRSDIPSPMPWIEMEIKHLQPPRLSKSENKVLQYVKNFFKKPPPRIVNVNDIYQFKTCLKRGQFTTVNKYFSTILKKNVAIKCITKNKISTEQLKKFLPRESNACLRVIHPNIVKYIEIFQSDLKLYIVMEWCEKGSLTKFIRERGKLDSVVYKKLFGQLAGAINYCFENGILHRKICTDNILVTKANNIKLCDFSFAKLVDQQGTEELYETLCGVLAFTAPEILECQPYDPYLSEVWSMGVVLYCMVYGVLPFDPTHYSQLLKQVKKTIVFKRYPDTHYACINLMHNMIAPANRRYNLYMVMNDPWLNYEKPVAERIEKWPQHTIEPWQEIKEKIEYFKEELNDKIMETIGEYTTDLYYEKLKKMNIKKKKYEDVPDRMNWLYKFYKRD